MKSLQFFKLIASTYLSIVLFTINCNAQNDICSDEKGKNYIVLQSGRVLTYNSLEGNKSHSTFTDYQQKIIDNKKYYQIHQVYGNSKRTVFQRETEVGVFMYDDISSEEVLLIPKPASVDYEVRTESWIYTITSLQHELRTPYCNYTNLMVLSASPTDPSRSEYEFYYKNGVGIVAVTLNSNILYFLSEISHQSAIRDIYVKVLERDISYSNDDKAIENSLVNSKAINNNEKIENCQLYLNTSVDSSLSFSDYLLGLKYDVGFDIVLKMQVAMNSKGDIGQILLIKTNLNLEDLNQVIGIIPWKEIKARPCTFNEEFISVNQTFDFDTVID